MIRAAIDQAHVKPAREPCRRARGRLLPAGDGRLSPWPCACSARTSTSAPRCAASRPGRTDIGAIVTFTGTVRVGNERRDILGMTLEHYPGMTEAELARVEAEAASRWPLQASLIVHRSAS